MCRVPCWKIEHLDEHPSYINHFIWIFTADDDRLANRCWVIFWMESIGMMRIWLLLTSRLEEPMGTTGCQLINLPYLGFDYFFFSKTSKFHFSPLKFIYFFILDGRKLGKIDFFRRFFFVAKYLSWFFSQMIWWPWGSFYRPWQLETLKWSRNPFLIPKFTSPSICHFIYLDFYLYCIQITLHFTTALLVFISDKFSLGLKLDMHLP